MRPNCAVRRSLLILLRSKHASLKQMNILQFTGNVQVLHIHSAGTMYLVQVHTKCTGRGLQLVWAFKLM